MPGFRYPLVAAAALISATAALHAAVITQTITISSDALGINPDGPPITSAVFNVTLTYDPFLNYAGSTEGIVVNSATPAYLADLPAGFIYDPSYLSGYLVIGGVLNGIGSGGGSTDDYAIYISGLNSPTPYAVIAISSAPYAGITLPGPTTVTITNGVPEPTMLAGLCATGLMLMRRQRSLLKLSRSK